jgi:hypothetical protein
MHNFTRYMKLLTLKRFLISWIITSIVMFILSYVWHGIFLNDFSRLSYPKEIFLFFAAITYLIIGFVVVKVFEAKFLEKLFYHRLFFKGLVKGFMCGFMFFIVATVVGVSFNTGTGIKNLLFDLAWQIFEQGIGGIVVSVTYVVFEFNLFAED